MSVKKIFWEDPYLTQLNATVKNINKDVITLDQTIAFAFSGGQQSDFGTIGGFNIITAKKDGNEIYYTIQQDHNLKSGDTVLIEIDWEKRYRLMKLHMSAELILELIYQNYNHPEKIGANITVDKARLDFVWEGNISEIFPELMDKVDYLIHSNLDIVSDFSDKANEKRYWLIEGFAKVPCGGTHLKKTGEIGSIILKRKNLGKCKERVEILLQPK